MDDNVIEFLEHHGVKGQQWGVRSSKRGGTKEQRSEGSKKLARNLGLATTAGAAAGFILSRRMMATPLTTLALTGGLALTGRNLVRHRIAANGDKPVSELGK